MGLKKVLTFQWINGAIDVEPDLLLLGEYIEYHVLDENNVYVEKMDTSQPIKDQILHLAPNKPLNCIRLGLASFEKLEYEMDELEGDRKESPIKKDKHKSLSEQAEDISEHFDYNIGCAIVSLACIDGSENGSESSELLYEAREYINKEITRRGYGVV